MGTIDTGAITAGSIAASALNGKGDWNIGKTGYSLTQAFPANFASLSITAGGLVDVTQTAADKVWATAARTLTAATNITSDASAINVTSGVIDTVTDLTVLSTTTRGEPGQGIPPETAAPLLKLDYMFKFQTNKLVQTGTQNEYYNRAGTVVDHKETTAEAAGVITVGNKVSGP